MYELCVLQLKYLDCHTTTDCHFHVIQYHTLMPRQETFINKSEIYSSDFKALKCLPSCVYHSQFHKQELTMHT